MSASTHNQPEQDKVAGTGNASNRSPETNTIPNQNQLLGKEAEKIYVKQAPLKTYPMHIIRKKWITK